MSQLTQAQVKNLINQHHTTRKLIEAHKAYGFIPSSGKNGSQGPVGAKGIDGKNGKNPMSVSTTPPKNPQKGDLWYEI